MHFKSLSRTLIRVGIGLLTLLGPALASNLHTVARSETLYRIAQTGGVSLETLLAINPGFSIQVPLEVGQVLVLPHRTALVDYSVVRGDTLYRVAKARGVALQALLSVNPGVSASVALEVGQILKLPPAPVITNVRPQVRAASFAPTARTSGWTTPVQGRLTTRYGGANSRHPGIDIAAPGGTPVQAARAGTVIEARFDDRSGWGWTVVLDHGGGLTSRYSHNSRLRVSVGDGVEQGEIIAEVGSTGNSTGPHLDYRVYQDGVALDPSSLE